MNTSPRITTAATRLQNAFAAGDAATATGLFSFDAVLEDMAAHSRVQGQPQIGRYLTRALPTVPYGTGASIAHVVGSRAGGGYEWHAAPSATPMRRGNTAIELDGDGKASRLTVVYDSGLLSYPAYQALVMLAGRGRQLSGSRGSGGDRHLHGRAAVEAPRRWAGSTLTAPRLSRRPSGKLS